MTIINRWARRLGFGGGSREERGAPQKPMAIPGAGRAPLMFMKPVDPAPNIHMAGWVQLKIDGIGGGYIDRHVVTTEAGPMDCALHCQPGLARLERALCDTYNSWNCAGANLPRTQSFVIVGEYAEEAGYDATLGAFRRREGTGIFWVYDAVPFVEWVNDKCSMRIEDRFRLIRASIPAVDSPFVGWLEPQSIDQPYQVLERTRELWREGYEGTVVKRRFSLYRRCRSDDWVRIKETITTDVLVLDVLHKGGRLAKVICRDPQRPGPEGTITLGSGWNDHEAALLEKMMSMDAGDRWIEIAYNKKAGSARPRHARFVRLRLSKEVNHGR